MEHDVRRFRQARLTRSTLLAAAAAAFLLGWPALASAEPTVADREAARNLMDDGDAKRDKGDLKAALKSYEAAEGIMHVPTTGLEVGRTQAQLGLLLEARETLARIARAGAQKSEPTPFTAARKTAASLVSEIDGRTPSITVVLTNADSTRGDHLALDGEAMIAGGEQEPRKVNPGRHTVALLGRSGAIEKKEDFTLAERESRTITIDAGSPAPSTPPLAVEAPKVDADRPPEEPSASSLPKILVISGFTVGAIGMIGGAVTGVMSLTKVNDVKKDCTGNLCPTNRQHDIDSAKTLGTISTIAFAVGGAGVLLGTIGLFLPSKTTPSAAPSNATAKGSTRVRLVPDVGPTWLGVRGSF